MSGQTKTLPEIAAGLRAEAGEHHRKFSRDVTVTMRSWTFLRMLSIVSTIGTALVAAIQAGTRFKGLAWWTVGLAFLANAAQIIMSRTRFYDWWQLRSQAERISQDLTTRAHLLFATANTPEELHAAIAEIRGRIDELKLKQEKTFFSLFAELSKGG